MRHFAWEDIYRDLIQLSYLSGHRDGTSGKEFWPYFDKVRLIRYNFVTDSSDLTQSGKQIKQWEFL